MRHISDDQLRDVVRVCGSVVDVLKHLNIPYQSKIHTLYSKRIKALKLDTAHFNRGGRGRSHPVLSWSEILVNNRTGKDEYSARLRGALIESGRAYVCAECGLPPLWNGKPLKLIVDHINAERLDNRPENLRFLCANCHLQTDTYGKVKFPRSTLGTTPPPALNNCKYCSIPTTNDHYCSDKCSRLGSNKIIWPDNLIELVQASSRLAVAKQLGVSETAVRKHLGLYKNKTARARN